MTVTYRVKGGSVAGRGSDVRLHAADRASAVHEASASVAIGTNTVLAAPAITPPAAHAGKPGEEFEVTWMVRNASNADRVLALDATGAGPELSIVSSAGAGEVTFAAFQTRAVTARYRVRDDSPAGARAAPALSATDKAAPAYSAQESFDFTTAADVRPPTLTGPAARSADPGTVTVGVFRLVNRSNLTRAFSLIATSTDASVVGDPADPAQVSVGAFGSVDVRVDAVVPGSALGYTQAGVVLTAVDAAAGANSGAAQFAVTVNAVYRAPSVTWQASRLLRPGEAAVDSATRISQRSRVSRRRCLLPRSRDCGATRTSS